MTTYFAKKWHCHIGHKMVSGDKIWFLNSCASWPQISHFFSSFCYTALFTSNCAKKKWQMNRYVILKHPMGMNFSKISLSEAVVEDELFLWKSYPEVFKYFKDFHNATFYSSFTKIITCDMKRKLFKVLAIICDCQAMNEWKFSHLSLRNKVSAETECPTCPSKVVQWTETMIFK